MRHAPQRLDGELASAAAEARLLARQLQLAQQQEEHDAAALEETRWARSARAGGGP
jgi:hypothetical protein